MSRWLLLVLGLVAGGALAQAQKPAAEEPKKAEPASRPLNLKLDGRAADYTRETPREGQADNLPGLGEGAMDVKSLPTPRSETVRSPFPNTPETSR